MSCLNCDCPTCKRDRGRLNRRRDLQTLCYSWLWNATPAEARQELQESVFSKKEAAEVMRAQGYPEEQIIQVTGD
jgi:hypothetical protein